MKMDVTVSYPQAARLRLFRGDWSKIAASRFHVVDVSGVPLCMHACCAPAYPADPATVLGSPFVPEDLRCHRHGCVQAWPREILV